MHRKDYPDLGLTYRDPQGVYTLYTHTGRTVNRLIRTGHRARGGMRARSPYVRPIRVQSAAADHAVDLPGSPHDSCTCIAAHPCLHTSAHAAYWVGQRVPNKSNLKELGSALLSLFTATHSGLHSTQACPSTGTSHANSQRAQSCHQVTWQQPPDVSHCQRRRTR